MTVQSFSDNKPLAMLCVSIAVALASTQDAFVKWMSGHYPIHEAMIIRCLVAVPLLFAIMWQKGESASLFTPHWRRTLMRGLILCSAYLAFTLSIAAMPMADSVAIYFTMPFFVAMLAGPLLGESVRPHRWLAISAGFLGVIIMINPGAGIFEPAALLAFYSAFGYGLGQTLGRDIARVVPPSVIAFHQNLIYLAVAGLFAALCNSVDFTGLQHKSLAFLLRPWAWPSAWDFFIMALLGALAAIAMVLFSTAYKLAESSFVAPFEYSSIFWAVVFGFVIFGDVPGLSTLAGGAIVILAGLFMLWMDRRVPQAAGRVS